MEKQKILLKGRIITPQGILEGRNLLEIANGRISYIGVEGSLFPGQEHQIYDFGPNYICPGFIDMHIHGCGGPDVMDSTFEALDWMSMELAEGGTTSFLATTMSASRDELVGVIKNIAEAKRKGTKGAWIIGAHLEGPFLNLGKKGAHKGEYLRVPNIHELQEYIDAGQGVIRMLTIAPELTGSTGVIELARDHGMLVSLGHSDASIAQVDEACRAGLSHVTHAFNAMAGLHHRDPGTIGAILSMKQLTVDVIPDGHHVHPTVIKILVHAKGVDQVCAITDCIRAGKMGNGVFELGGQKVTVKNGISYLDDGTMSGSTLTMAAAMRVMVDMVGLTLEEAVKLTSANPARILGLSDKGSLEQGKDADIVVLDHHLQVLMTIIGGKVAYKK